MYAIIRLPAGRMSGPFLDGSGLGRIHLVAALLGGIGLGVGVDIIAHATTQPTHVIHMWNLILLEGLLGPIIEESLFRGCLLPVVARATGPTIGISVTACSSPRSTGQHIRAMVLLRDHGDLRLDGSESNRDLPRASALMHAIYNATLFIVPTFLDKRGGRAADQISRQGTSFA